MGGDYWFTYIYESQTAERIRAAEQERLAAEIRSVYRQQQLAARRRRHQVKLTVSKPAELVEVAGWASSPTEFIEWIGEDPNWPPTDDPMAPVFEVTESAANYGTADRFGGGPPIGETR